MSSAAQAGSEAQVRFRLVDIHPEPGAAILHQRQPDGTLWGTRGRRIVVKPTSGGTWQEIARLPFAWGRDSLAFNRLAARALRADKANVFVNSRSKVLAVRNSVVYRIQPDGAPIPLFHIQGDSVLHGGICEDARGWTYLGEYFMNPARGPVRIWRINPDLDDWEIAREFPAGSIRHVHGIYRDPYDEQALWVTSGDGAGECCVFRTRDRFTTLETFGDGGQASRAVRLFFTPGHVCWLTDSQLETNHAVRMARGGGPIEQGEPLAAPAWYGTTTVDGTHVAFTTVEPGPAVRRTSAAVLISEDAFHWHELHSFEKDLWRPMKVFKYGVISCAAGPMDLAQLFISGEGLKGLDGISAWLEIERAGK